VPQPRDSIDAADPQPVEPRLPRTAAAVDEPPTRQCGRCRLLFEGDPTLHPTAQPDWWLCPPCRAILLGGRPHPSDVARRRHVGETS
jgi:hypothetical protein